MSNLLHGPPRRLGRRRGNDARNWLETPLGQFHRSAPVIEPAAEAPKPPPSAEVIKFPEKTVARPLLLGGADCEEIERVLYQPEFRQLVAQLHKMGPYMVGYIIATFMAQAHNLVAEACSEGEDYLLDMGVYPGDPGETLAELYDRPLEEWLSEFLFLARHLTTPKQVRK